MKKCIEGPDYKVLAVNIISLLLALFWVIPSWAESNRNIAASGGSHEDTLRLGERMYREGVLPSGDAMQAIVKGDIPVAGTAFTCVSCHLRSGLGSYEGGVLTPPTNGRNLFRTVKMLYKGVEMTSLPTRRPAYTDASLAEALRVGVDPSGRIMSEIMPRYQLQDEDMALLISYLKSLSAQFSPGATDATVRLATVITDDVDDEDRDAMLGPLEDYVRRMNNSAKRYGAYGANQLQAGMAESKLISRDAASMSLSLSQWLLKGPPETWRSQLEEYYRKEPVFALVGGITKKEWQPVHMFSEDHQIPCILPITDFPVISETDWDTLYFSKGLYQEGEGVARYLNAIDESTNDKSVVEVVHASREGRALSSGFQETWRELGRSAPVTVELKAGETLTPQMLQQLLAGERPAALVVWAGPDVLPALETLPDWKNKPEMVFLSSSYLGESIWTLKDQVRDFIRITYPFRLPEDEERYTRIAKSSMRIDKDQGGSLIISKKIYSTIKVLNQALIGISGQYYRDNLLDAIDMGKGSVTMGKVVMDETYPLYERFSFGPGQRYASKGCYIVRLSKGEKPELVRMSDWVIH